MVKRFICIIFLLILCLSGCTGGIPRHYEFKNLDQKIQSVELFYNHWALNSEYRGQMFESIRVLDETEVTSFMEAVRALETRKQHSPPRRKYGEYVAKVTYANGDVEMFGSWHIEYVKKGAEYTFQGIYYFDQKTFEELFFEYAGTRYFGAYRYKKPVDPNAPYEGPIPPWKKTGDGSLS